MAASLEGVGWLIKKRAEAELMLAMHVLNADWDERIAMLNELTPSLFSDPAYNKLVTVLKSKEQKELVDFKLILDLVELKDVSERLLQDLRANPDGYFFDSRFKAYLKKLQNYAALREIVEVSVSMQDAVTTRKSSPPAIITAATSRFNSIMKDQGHEDVSISEAIGIFREAGKDKLFFETGLKPLDDLVSGLKRGRLWVLGGGTGSGKSNFAIQFAVNQMLEGRQVFLISTELTKEAIVERVLYNLRYKFPMLSEPELLEMLAMQDNLRISTELRGLPEILFEVKRLKVMGELDFVILDHLQDLDMGAFRTEYELIRTAAGELKDLALSENIAVLAISQLNRQAAGKKEDFDTFGFQGSGKIEQVAHVAMVIKRAHDSEGKTLSDAYIIVKKCRSDGQTGTVNSKVHRDYHIFLPPIEPL